MTVLLIASPQTSSRAISMDARDIIKIGMSAERTLVVAPERTVGHFVQGMPLVDATVRATAKVIAVERRVIRFEVEAFEGTRKLGEGRHARGLVNLESFNKRLGAGW